MKPLAAIILSTTLWRWSLGLYGLILAIGTHWPRLRIDGPVARSDLYIHVAAFGVLGGVLTLAALWGAPASRRNLVRALAVGVVFAALDEITQANPGLGRTAGFDDFLADVVGLSAGVASAALLARSVSPRGRTATG